MDRVRETHWSHRGLPVRVAVAGARRPTAARRVVAGALAGLDRVTAPGRGELARVHRAAGRPVPVGPLLRDLVAVALDAARASDGDCDPTIGASRIRLAARGGLLPVCGFGTGVPLPADDWRAVSLRGDRLTVPPTLLLVLGGTATAYLAQRCAARIAERSAGGVLVAIGSRVAAAGPVPRGGWPVPVGGRTIRLRSGGLATASACRPDGGGVLDPPSGRAPDLPRSAVTVAAPDTVRAATLAITALVRGTDGPGWLAGQDCAWWIDPDRPDVSLRPRSGGCRGPLLDKKR
ncbi:FAD:protein FMN transferase [Micromonospora sagamiensis]|uniref:Thiamine biosynthesis lipoprotein ApbE n=1 Tax=Micromonospora sagamiensis TaxID=47875 RepID=A0A562WK11_9ACTN|nr:FAD:protein FMN transferase [Micromonospora sagamiensis]TWJ29874.1 thiamine biosynthesis lipoprotein ApbE [Micromonospora sagamiensis]